MPSNAEDSLCPLCFHKAQIFCELKGKVYLSCSHCKSLFLHSSYLPQRKEERKRYTFHQNSITDTGYKQFIHPLIELITNTFDQKHSGLDYGCGQKPVFSKILRQKGLDITPYDPFFFNHPKALKTTYDFIVCCEVIEHFHHPQKEFRTLKKLLNSQGKLYCKTNLITPKIKTDFINWWYKNDKTHVFFYAKETFQYICKQFNYKSLHLTSDYVVLEN